ncbi:AMP-binding protein [Motiliproteus sp. MSK22-1]|uniref:AMP-binding protein n=1 Tax=Motiliproteus sp. MSK22-1 TaxID=1897630 RepID=UPI0009786374|nr:AMP-binding protein [Motiliproteus sp. MSK22-1]OMH29134.1 hypothetical protein BGP75_20505 [Motiliproteus sp. MSK22-1]
MNTAQYLASFVTESVIPEATAVKCQGDTISYQQLAGRALQVASELQFIVTSGEEPVAAVIMEKGIGAVEAIIGSLAAGIAYAPIAPENPLQRILSILKGLTPDVIITDAHSLDKLEGVAAELGIPVLNNDSIQEQAGSNKPLPVLKASPNSLAAVLHTSGSTGKPKSVYIGAAQIVTFAEWVCEEFDLNNTDVLLNHAPLAFDLTFLDLFATFKAGAKLVLTRNQEAANSQALQTLCKNESPTFWHSTPTSLRLLVHGAEQLTFPAMKHVLFAGEPMSVKLLNAAGKIFVNAEHINIYGCSETNDTFYYRCPIPFIGTTIPIGKPLPYTQWKILNEQKAPCREGELWVHCPTMMRHYGDKVLTDNAFTRFDGKQYFRTRDKVRIDEDGLMHFLGRTDWTAKINGYRIDLQDVEQSILESPEVSEAIAFVQDIDGVPQLEAAVSCDPEFNSLKLRQCLMAKLPTYGIPRRFHLTQYPLEKNSNGKLCRKTIAGTYSLHNSKPIALAEH